MLFYDIIEENACFIQTMSEIYIL